VTAHTESLPRRLGAEGLGSLLLAATVVGSGIMAERLSGGNLAVALLANTAATVAVLAVLIALLGPVSGAHFNPAVSIVEALRGRLAWRDAGSYTALQIVGCCAGALIAHVMDAPWMVAAWIGAAYWFTASTSFANPAITIARSLTNTFAGIRPADMPAFIGAQFVGALSALAVARALFPIKKATGWVVPRRLL
jgi:glycerol uptake facilitator-like aquaporin